MPIDLSTPLGVTTALLPEVVLSVAALAVLLLTAFRHTTAADSRLAGWCALAGIAASAAGLAWLWSNGAEPVGVARMVALDTFRFAGSALILVVAAGVVLLSLSYNTRESLLAPEYYVLLLLATVGLTLMAASADLILLFLGLELMSVAVYVLAGFDRRDAHSAEGALKYFLVGAFASGFLLYGIALVYGATGTTNLVFAGLQLAGGMGPMAHIGLGLLLIGFAFKVAAVPFHAWAPDVYEGSPTPVTAYMAAGVKVAAVLALGRVLVTVFPAASASWQSVLGGLAILTMVAGNLIALQQRGIKRMLAYSSVAHAGYLLAGLVPGTGQALSGVVVYLVGYALTTIAVFGILSVLGTDGERDVTLDRLAGLAGERPWLATALAICMLSLLGFPGTIGFIGKWAMLNALLMHDQYLLAVVLVLTSVVAAGYYLPVIMAAFMRPTATVDGHAAARLPGPAAVTVLACVLVVLALGLWPSPLLDSAATTAASLSATAGQVMGAMP